MPLTIITWNVENFNHAKSLEGATQAAFQILGTVADILIIQELTPNENDAMETVGVTIETLEQVDPNWNGRYSPANASTLAAERYAMFWRNTREPTLIYQSRNFPAVCNAAGNFGGSPFAARNPYYFTFNVTLAGVAGQTLRVLTHHAPTAAAQITADLAALNVAELAVPIHSVICGDFNTGADLAAAYGPLMGAGFVQTVTTPTSLNACLPTWNHMYLSQPYDRLLYRNLAPIAGGAGVAFGVIDFVLGQMLGAADPRFIPGFVNVPMFPSDALWLISQISDHLPVFTCFL